MLCSSSQLCACFKLQELLEHPFLRPTAATVPAQPSGNLVGLSKEQLKLLLGQVRRKGLIDEAHECRSHRLNVLAANQCATSHAAPQP